MEELVRLRHELHRNPELSGHESATAKRLRFFLSRYNPDELYSNIAGEGMAVIYQGKEPGPTVLFRCDMDALPITETNDVKYKSNAQGVSHVCGHDGHMAILSGLAVRLSQNKPKRGRVILFYQPSEENGEGARKSLERLKELGLNPDFAVALHNLPGYKMGSIILSRYTFSSASKGLIINLKGKPSHAAYPEHGLNPAAATAEIIQSLLAIQSTTHFKNFTLVTIIHIRVGDIAFGTSPGSATIMATLRAFDDDDMTLLSEKASNTAISLAQKHKLGVDVSFTDEYPASVCDKTLTHTLEAIAHDAGIEVNFLDQPNRWSEDFAHFSTSIPSVIFGLGAGENHPDIHTPEYDFPDELIDGAVDFLEKISNKLIEGQA